MTPPVIRIAGAGDAPALAALRRAWTAEQHGPADDEGFEARFLDWYERESGRRVSWLAEMRGEMVGMVNLAVFERMPQPGSEAGSWGYLANAFVLAAYRNQGIGYPCCARCSLTPTTRATCVSCCARRSGRSRSTSGPASASTPGSSSGSAVRRCLRRRP